MTRTTYTMPPLAASYGGGAHAISSTASFQVSFPTHVVFPGTGNVAETNELVITNSRTEGSLVAASNKFITPAIVTGMTLFGSGSLLVTAATCAIAETPLVASSKAAGALKSGTSASSKAPVETCVLKREVSQDDLAMSRTVPRTPVDMRE
jgi:hypothetical protein